MFECSRCTNKDYCLVFDKKYKAWIPYCTSCNKNVSHEVAKFIREEDKIIQVTKKVSTMKECNCGKCAECDVSLYYTPIHDKMVEANAQ